MAETYSHIGQLWTFDGLIWILYIFSKFNTKVQMDHRIIPVDLLGEEFLTVFFILKQPMSMLFQQSEKIVNRCACCFILNSPFIQITSLITWFIWGDACICSITCSIPVAVILLAILVTRNIVILNVCTLFLIQIFSLNAPAGCTRATL